MANNNNSNSNSNMEKTIAVTIEGKTFKLPVCQHWRIVTLEKFRVTDETATTRNGLIGRVVESNGERYVLSHSQIKRYEKAAFKNSITASYGKPVSIAAIEAREAELEKFFAEMNIPVRDMFGSYDEGGKEKNVCIGRLVTALNALFRDCRTVAESIDVRYDEESKHFVLAGSWKLLTDKEFATLNKTAGAAAAGMLAAFEEVIKAISTVK